MKVSSVVSRGVAGLLLMCWQLAFAHSHLEKSIPANGSTVAKAPTELVLTFKDEVQITAVTVESSSGKHELKVPAIKAKQTHVPVEPLVPGMYTVNWRAAGDDGHVMSGKFSFTISAGK